ncbi:hypothetical protein HDZ31DRAFT_23559, partial [Schizophyllum fasciatum]
KVAELGVKGRAKLNQLTKSKILTRRANGLVLLRKAQAGIMKRKMEVERAVGSHRNKHGEKKLRKHITTAAERREGTVKSIVSKYNKACRDLATMIKREIARKGRCAIRPLTELPTAGIWDLGIDNACWDNLRFDGDATDRAPAWMSDHNTRQAIRARLLLDRCAEEDARLAHERANVLDWMEGEWLTVATAKRAALRAPVDAPALIHQLRDRERALLRMAEHWDRLGLPVRGPTRQQIAAAREDWANASCDVVQPLRVTEARTTRSGAAFNNYIPIPVDVDLEELFERAEAARAQASGDYYESDMESDLSPAESSDSDSELSPPPVSRNSSPLPDLTESEEEAAHHEPAAGGGLQGTSPLQGGPGNSKARKSARQRKRRRAEIGNVDPSSKRLRANKILDATEEHVEYNFKKAPVTRTGFTCLRDAGEMGIAALESHKGYSYVDWDGGQPTAFVAGKEEVVIAALLGAPKGEGWVRDHEQLADELEASRGRMTFSADEREHRRGCFSVKAHGSSMGGGQTAQQEPRPLKHSDITRGVVARLNPIKPLQGLAHFGSSGFGGWEPKIHSHYADLQKKLLGWKPHLRRRLHFKKSVWMCVTINFGPRTLCYPHRDFGNLAHGFCAITALGRFNPDKGGHIVLRELKLVIRFPPGSTILIPSALITHYNIDILEGETRYSVTQYTSGGLFRFVEHDFKLNEEYYAGM